MSSDYTKTPAPEHPQAKAKQQAQSKPGTAKTEGAEELPPLQFVTTTSSVELDDLSKRAIRKHASRYVYRAKPQQSYHGNPSASERIPKRTIGGQIHRFRLSPEGLKHTPNQPPQPRKTFEIVCVKDDLNEEEEVAKPLLASPLSRQGVHFFGDDEEFDQELFPRHGSRQFKGSFENLDFFELVRRSNTDNGTRLDLSMVPRGSSLFGPSSGAMDPFNAMALPITPREQILLLMDTRQVDTPLISCCQAWFGLAVQDKAYLHAVLSHYSATYRLRFQEESPMETISNLTGAIHLITERLQDPRQCCSNGTIGAVASLLIYESHNGALPNVSYHMRGLKKMIMRRGGLERADFPLDLKRLIGWTDLNTANCLWQRPHFPALKLPVSFRPRSILQNDVGVASSSGGDASQTTIDMILTELRSFAVELVTIKRSLNPLNRPQISTSDKIHVLERKVFDLIHTPFPSNTHLDHACAIATLIFMRSDLRDNVCNFRIIETAKLQASLMDLGDLWQWGSDPRNREKLIWTVGFGAVSSAGRSERGWFEGMFRHVCENLGFGRWGNVKAVFETVLWKSELDVEGTSLWEDMGMDEM